MPNHADVPVFTAYKPGVDLYALFESLKIHTEAGADFALSRPDFGNEYCRVRIPQSRYDLVNMDYRFKGIAND